MKPRMLWWYAGMLCAGVAIATQGAAAPIDSSAAKASTATIALSASSASEESDLGSARALFERNLDAIRRRDRDAYLACYLQSGSLARTGPGGVALGFEGLAKSAGEGWPDVFDAQDLQLVAVAPGVVYGTYRYRVGYLRPEGGDEEQNGLSERFFLKTPEGWKIAVTTAFPAPPGTPPPPRALVGAVLVDGTGGQALPDAVVLLRGGTIDCAGSGTACPVPAGVGVVDLAGRWITPGLVDAHVHFSQTGWADGRPDALDVRAGHPYAEVERSLRAHPERFFRSDLCSGVTSVFDVGGYPWTLELPARAAEDPRAPHVRAAGPLLSTIDFWLNLPGERQFIFLKDEAAARDGVAYLQSLGAAAVKVWFIVPPDADFAAMARAVSAAGDEARKRNLPLIVHATGLREAKEALRAGAKLLVHSVWDQPVDEEFLSLAKVAGAIYCPTLTVIRGYQRLFEAVAVGRAPSLDDPNGCVDGETRKRLAETAALGAESEAAGSATWGFPRKITDLEARAARTLAREQTAAANLKRVRDAGIPIAMGTDAGNPLTLHGPSVYAEMEAMQKAGMSAMEVLVASTSGGARAMGLEKEIGTIEKGKAADLLILAADPTKDIANLRQLQAVVRGGVLRSIEELRAVEEKGPPQVPPGR